MNGRSRQLYTGGFRFVLVSLLAMVFLLGMAFLVAELLAFVQDNSWNHPTNVIIGLCCGLISWLFIAVFHLRHETQNVPISQREPFLAEAATILTEMGYALSAQLSDDL